MTQRTIENLFPTPVTIIDFDNTEFCKKYSKLVLDNLTDIDQDNLKKYNISTTADQLHLLPDFQFLYELIDKEVTMFFEDSLGLSREDVTMTSMWINVQNDGCRHQTHQHPNSFYSGVLYLEVPTGPDVIPGVLIFEDPRPAKNMWHANYSKENALSNRSFKYPPKSGRLMLFPSWLEHGTDVCRAPAGSFRISLSFNYMLIRSTAHTMTINLKP
jgi:uncharacterized protein (TIGR02466 family)